MHPWLFNRAQTGGKVIGGQAISRPRSQAPSLPGSRPPAPTFGRALGEALGTRHDQPTGLAGKRQEFPRFRALRAVGDAHLASLLSRTAFTQPVRRSALPAQTRGTGSGRGTASSRSEVERYFRSGSGTGRQASYNSEAFEPFIKEASLKHQVPEGLIKAVIKVESNFNARATSPKGAMGLMQLMPGTARDLGVSQGYDPRDNINGGTRYLRELLDRYQGNVPMALAAYNWGPGNLEKGRSLPRETRNYLEMVGRLYPLQQSPRAKVRQPTPPPTPSRTLNLGPGITI